MNTVDANAAVCTRCQTVVQAVHQQSRRRSSVWWSPRRGFSFGQTGYYTPGKMVCGYCGSGGLVPAGTPRGRKILEHSGVTVTQTFAWEPEFRMWRPHRAVLCGCDDDWFSFLFMRATRCESAFSKSTSGTGGAHAGTTGHRGQGARSAAAQAERQGYSSAI